VASTPSQTVGPFFSFALPFPGGAELVDPGDPRAVRIDGVVLDGDGRPVNDALVELWQANAAGRYDHPDDAREDVPLEQGFRGFGRCPTDGEGRFAFVTVKPGAVPGDDGAMQAPHINVSVLARGVLKRIATRIYFPDEAEANEGDPVLSSVQPDRRHTLIAAVEGAALRFDIELQGERETVFFDV
jgi:protocatechuate 3,4-dioxygenase, alpha subunit